MVVLHFVYALYLHFFNEDGNFVEERNFPNENMDYNQGVLDVLNTENFYHNASSLMGNFEYERYLFDRFTNELHIWAEASEKNLLKKLAKELYYMDPDRGNDLTGLDTKIEDNIIVVPRIIKVYADDAEVNVSELPDYE